MNFCKIILGSHCETRQNACLSDPCENGGVCKYHHNSTLYCDCPSNFNGTYCENYIDPCQFVTCLNHGSCIDDDGVAECECSAGFGGENCDQRLDGCQNDFCASGICLSNNNGYFCDCPPGTMGKRCHLTACDNLPCPQNSECENLLTVHTTKDSYRQEFLLTHFHTLKTVCIN